MKVTEDDLLNLARLKKLLEDGTFPLQKREVQPFVEVINWQVDMSKRVHAELNKPKPQVKKKKKITKKVDPK